MLPLTRVWDCKGMPYTSTYHIPTMSTPKNIIIIWVPCFILVAHLKQYLNVTLRRFRAYFFGKKCVGPYSTLLFGACQNSGIQWEDILITGFHDGTFVNLHGIQCFPVFGQDPNSKFNLIRLNQIHVEGECSTSFTVDMSRNFPRR